MPETQELAPEIEHAAQALAATFRDVAVGCASVDEAAACDGGALPSREQLLGDRFRWPRRKAEFVAGRLAARQALLRLLGEATPVEILKDATGAPWVVTCPSLHVSISHSKGVALAVAARSPVGIDLEADEVRPASFSSLFCTDSEQRALSESPARQVLLNTLWTRKEAVSKVGRWGGSLAFSRLDCLGSSIRIADHTIEMRSTEVAGHVLSIAAEQQESFAYG